MSTPTAPSRGTWSTRGGWWFFVLALTVLAFVLIGVAPEDPVGQVQGPTGASRSGRHAGSRDRATRMSDS